VSTLFHEKVGNNTLSESEPLAYCIWQSLDSIPAGYDEDGHAPMKRLNTYDTYRLALSVHPLVDMKYLDGMELKSIYVPLIRAHVLLVTHCQNNSFFSPSMKRSAAAITRAIADVAKVQDIFQADPKTPISTYELMQLVQRTKDFETVLSNEMPGLAIYHISTKGIYSTDDLISHAELHIPESLRDLIDSKAVEDIQQAGKCLAYEVSTASAFHMWRAVETVMGSYYKYLNGGVSFEDDGIQRNWGAYIAALNDKDADGKITTFLDHIRSEYRNPQTHPSEAVDLEEAFGLFGVATSVITQMAKAMKPNASLVGLPELLGEAAQ
jgi:hypothetical protein